MGSNLGMFKQQRNKWGLDWGGDTCRRITGNPMPHVPSRTMNQTAAALGQCWAAWGSTRRGCLTRLTVRFSVVTFERPRFMASWPVGQPLPVAPNESRHYFLVMRLYHLCHPTCWWSHSHTFLRESAYNYSLWKRHKVAQWSCVLPTTN